LWIFYEHGHHAVEFFWMISGFVFAYVYAGTRSSTRRFVAHRFARLYPLHFVTLLVVAALQYLSWRQTGRYQIYASNDLYHFLLNLFFVSHWGFQSGFSFNAPIWSVSVEVFVYGVFWIVLAILFRRGIAGSIAMMAAFATLAANGTSPFWLCGYFFFAGVVLFLVQEAFKTQWPILLSIGLALCVGGATMLSLGWDEHGLVGLPLLFAGLVVLISVLDQSAWSAYGRSAQWIGDNAYGMYLWHIPLQILVLLAIDFFVIDKSIVETRVFLLSFVLSVVLVARVSYLGIERPARNAIRERFAQEPATIDPSVEPSPRSDG
jgi:peptidoglycan/LPS O-acetylase OafA/YrhL